MENKHFFFVRRTEKNGGDAIREGIQITAERFPDPIFREFVRSLAADGETLPPSDTAALTVLDVSGRGISDLSGVEIFSGLECLYCQGNLLSTLDVRGLAGLRELDCSDNRLTALSLEGAVSLRYLYCFGNRLPALDVSGCPELLYLYCEKNRLESLDLRENPKLTELSCFQNHLEKLDVSRNLCLTELYCFSNRLCSLDVSACVFLRSLDCADNCQRKKLGEDRTLRLCELDGLDLKKTDAWAGGTVSGDVLTVNEETVQVTYRYEVAPGRRELFFLRFV